MGTVNVPPSGNTGAAGGGNPPPDQRLELYKLEYERAAIRYDNIYSALWQIFSYMSAISAALLAFGGDRFEEKVFWLLALSPLVFWFWCTYEPLNKYGTNCGERLAKIEEELNTAYGVRMDHYGGFSRRTNRGEPQRHRVQYKMRLVFRTLSLIWVFLSLLVARSVITGHPLRKENPTEAKIVTVDATELKKLLGSANGTGKTPPIPQTQGGPNKN